MSDEHGPISTGSDEPTPQGREALGLALGRREAADGLEWLLAQAHPAALVRRLPEQDFYWLVKGVGSEESAPLLELASETQWQYLLDLEIWDRDRVDLGAVGRWLQRLIQADAPRLIDWLFGEEGELLAYAYLSQIVDVFIPEPDADHLIPEDYTNLDGVHFIYIRQPELRPALETLLRILSMRDSLRCASFLGTLAGLIPGEAEEELYRLRSARLAEKGFRPFEEALAAYAPLDPEALRGEASLPVSPIDLEGREQAPLLPLARLGGESLLGRVMERIADPLLLDRLRLEFATLANQILSAEGRPGIEYADLLGSCRKTLGYISLALEATAAGDPAAAEEVLRRHHLLAVFRAGVGLVTELKRDLERWLSAGWFRRQGLADAVWGEAWQGTIAGLLRARPLYHAAQADSADLRDFARLAELEECRLSLRRLRLLDALLQTLTTRHPPLPAYLQTVGATFHPLLFNAWAREWRGMPPSLEALELAEARAFLESWQAAMLASPGGRPAVETAFVEAMAARQPDLGTEDAAILRETLRLLYREFVAEYVAVAPEDLDPRYSRLLALRRA